jgi:hypothetical protein
VDTPGNAVGVAISGTLAYVADYYCGLQVIDIANPESPRIVGNVDTPGLVHGVAVGEAHVYVTDDWTGFWILPLHCAESPPAVLISGLEAVPSVQGILIRWEPLSDVFVAFFLERALSTAQNADYVRLNPTEPIAGPGPWQFSDTDVRPGETYRYRIIGVTPSGEERAFGPVTASTCPITRLALRGAFPNPAGGQAWIQFELPARTELTLSIHDISGRLVATLLRGPQDEGSHGIVWDSRDGRGRPVPSGAYFARLQTPRGAVAQTRIVLTR